MSTASQASNPKFTRPYAGELLGRLEEPRRFLQVIAGPRQVGKTTMVEQVSNRSDLPCHYASADEPQLRGPEWIAQQWDAARLQAAATGDDGALLVLDEVQKAPQWAEAVKRLWDEDTRRGLRLKVVLLGSAPLLVGQGLTESLAGRFEVLHTPPLELLGDAGGLWMDAGPVPLLRGVSRRRPSHRAAGALGPATSSTR